MREIKFDLVMENKHTGEIHHKKYYLKQLMMGIEKLFDIENYVTVADRQYTGLFDKNGKEIYEGDIIRILYTDWPSNHTDLSLEDYKKSISHYGEVIFNDLFGNAKYELSNRDWRGSITPGTHGELEIIGNIFENPELLETQS